MKLTDRQPGFVPVAPSSGRFRPLGSDEVHITGGFWAERQRVNARNTLPHINHWLEREGWLPNFDLAAQGTLPAGRRGRQFSDSEIYKYLEALAWEIGRSDDQELETLFRSIVARVAAAQEPDGYLNTYAGRAGQPARWSDLEWGHELYCFGHLFQAAVARVRTRPDADDGLLAVAVRAADLVCAAFGADGIHSICGHAVVETGLAELARAVGEPRYLEQARLFVERHGQGTLKQIEPGQQYFQDDLPIRTATVSRGHAVRANYLAAGAVDVAVDTGDDELMSALETQWRNTVARRTYITGGQGSHHQDEAFGEDWELPPDRAYSETCASVASVMFSWRLALARGDARYSDLVERTLFNVVATSPSNTGTAFYYANTLHQRTPGTPAADDAVSPRAESSLRAPWFDVSCCPPNVARTLASLDAFVATADDEGLQLHQYVAGSIRTKAAGQAIAFDIDTDYPRSGSIRVTAVAAVDEPITLSLRIPHWASDAELRVRSDGDVVTSEVVQPGWAAVRRSFRAGDCIELDLPVEPRVVHPDGRIDAVRGCVAVERGPEVFCLESVDLDAAGGGDDVGDIRLDPAAPILTKDGVPVVRVLVGHPDDAEWPYGSGGQEPPTVDAVEVPLVPYHDWAERGPSTMRVWLPVAP